MSRKCLHLDLKPLRLDRLVVGERREDGSLDRSLGWGWGWSESQDPGSASLRPPLRAPKRVEGDGGGAVGGEVVARAAARR